MEASLAQKCLKTAEAYLQLKPWVYGTVTKSTVVVTCIDVARQKSSEDAQLQVMLNIVSVLECEVDMNSCCLVDQQVSFQMSLFFFFLSQH